MARIFIICLIVLNIMLFLLCKALLADEIYYPIGTNPISTTNPFAGETIYPEGEPFAKKYGINFWLYNDTSGLLDLNLGLLRKSRMYTSPPVVSPNFDNIVYTEVYYYADVNEVVSKSFYVPVVLPQPTDENPEISIEDYYKSYSLRSDDLVRYEIMSVTSKIFRYDIFKTLTVVDWAWDSNRVLIKEHIGRMRKGIAGTIPWVYDVHEDKLYRNDTVRKAIITHWKRTQNLDLNLYVWDIDIIGWEKDNNNRFVVSAYLYPEKLKKKFLGCWRVDINGNMTELLSLDNEHCDAGRYGLIPELH
ncbi:MAG: hypothetical protein AB1782_09755 [Cyanobacteriota bacterium]